MGSNRTIVAIATPPGRGGVAIIRMSGTESLALSKILCRDNQITIQPRVAQLCRWFDAEDELIDSGIILYFPAPNSYTGEDVVELQAHGSPILLQSLLLRLISLGAIAAEPGEFTRRAVENGKMNLSQAEAVVACIDAVTERAARQAQRHLAGEFGSRIEHLMNALTSVVAHVEASLDFPEEEIPTLFFDKLKLQVENELVVPLQTLLKTAVFGERLFEGVIVAIIGAPNVGKSSLMNRLLGRDCAIVSDIAGTTRDVLEADFEVHGIPVRLADTAGIRQTDHEVEREGVRRASLMAERADIVVFVADYELSDSWKAEQHADLFLMNKCDLRSKPFMPIPRSFIPVSVQNGEGIDDFIDALANLLGHVEGESVMVTQARHRQALSQALNAIEEGVKLLGSEEHFDLVAFQWRQAWTSLGEILGVGDIEHILDRVFSEFCIGK
ncbi:MAG: tRNA uridine-5-carboxymethylaminomethyl(34) synthesis GTPase MnmE [Mariprofundaceae bacterium]